MKTFEIKSEKTNEILKTVTEKDFKNNKDVTTLCKEEEIILDGGIMLADRTSFDENVIIKRIN